MACEDNGDGRFENADDDLASCVRHQKENGRSFVTYWENKCYGSTTCSNPYSLRGAINYEVKHCAGNTSRQWALIKLADSELTRQWLKFQQNQFSFFVCFKSYEACEADLWDCDGIPDDEYNDYDNDGIPDSLDHDDDNDGIPDVLEPGNRLNEIPREYCVYTENI